MDRRALRRDSHPPASGERSPPSLGFRGVGGEAQSAARTGGCDVSITTIQGCARAPPSRSARFGQRAKTEQTFVLFALSAETTQNRGTCPCLSERDGKVSPTICVGRVPTPVLTRTLADQDKGFQAQVCCRSPQSCPQVPAGQHGGSGRRRRRAKNWCLSFLSSEVSLSEEAS